MPVDLFSPSDLYLIFFGTNALLRTYAPGATFGPDIPALALHVDCRDRYIMSHFIVAQRFAFERILPIRRTKNTEPWRTRLQRLEFLDVTYQLIQAIDETVQQTTAS
jgi:hypothetical protein